ncbi:MAG: hypothetical protein IJU77_11505 [Butyrivibrio sp.]|nr:hypothetical protein [Butyrivibrio sp.]
MKNKLLSLLLGSALGLLAGQEAWKAQNLVYIQNETKIKISDLPFSEDQDYEVMECE